MAGGGGLYPSTERTHPPPVHAEVYDQQGNPYHAHGDKEQLLERTEVGYHARRTGCFGCTDAPFLLVFILASAAYAYLGYTAHKKGDPLRLLYGTDYLGNICGRTGSKSAPREPPEDLLGGVPWKERKLLWYPFDPMKPTQYDEQADQALCVAECPADGAEVATYGTDNGYISPPNGGNPWISNYESELLLRRCLPLPSSNLSDARAASDVTDSIYRGIHDIEEAYETILYAMAVAVGIAIVWLIFVCLFTTPVVFITILALIAGTGGGGYLLWKRAKDLKDDGNDDYKWIMAGAIALFVISGVVLLMTVFMCKALCRGAAIVKEASRVMLTTPSLTPVPPCIAVLLCCFFALSVYILLCIQTIEDRELEEFTDPDNTTGPVSTLRKKIPLNRTGLQLYGVFCFIWGSVFLLDLGYLTVALVAAWWFFSGAEEKDPPCCSAPRALLCALRHHLGTLAVGSFLIAVCKFIRFIIMWMQKKLEKSGVGEKVRCILCIAQCCVQYIERVLKLIAESAYIVTAIEGTSFCPSAMRALELIVKHPVSLFAVAIVSGIMTFLGRFLVVVGSVWWAYMALDRWGVSDNVDDLWVPLVVVGVLAFFVAGGVVKLFSAVVDTVAMCHFVDEDKHGGRFTNKATRQLMRNASKVGAESGVEYHSPRHDRRGDGVA